MYYRCELLVGGNVHDVTNDLVNWDDVEMSFKRNDYDGVVRSFSTKFEFSGGAYSLLLREYQTNYLNSSATIVFYVRNNSWLLNEKFRCALDYSTFTYTDISCEINAVDDSLASLIKAKKGTQYEYLVSELKENEPLYYDRLQMSSEIKWLPTGETNDDYVTNTYEGNSVIPLYIYGTPEIAIKDIVEVQDVPMPTEITDIKDLWFFRNVQKGRAAGEGDISVNINWDVNVLLTGITSEYSATLQLTQYYRGAQDTVFLQQLVPGQNNVQIKKENYTIFREGRLVFRVNVTGSVTIKMDESIFSLNFDEISKDKINIDIIKPVTLLNRLLKSMNNEKAGLTGEISINPNNPDMENITYAQIVAAESVRGLDNAKIYTSYTKFSNWMSSVFGFVPVIGDNKVTFVHRDILFQDKQVKDLKDDTVDLNYNVSSSMIYSRIKVGYDKQDYDSVNGRDEFHFTNEYTTGITLTENVKELISPYRADAYGIEFLVVKRGEDTTDNDSDSDIFFVGAELEGEKYKLVRSGYTISGVISPSTMFNAMYSQRYMIKANARYLAAFSEKLSFASSDGNSDVEINGVRETNDIALGNRLFTVGELSVETGDQGTPSDLSGYIRIEKNGNVYKGFVKSVSYNHGKAKPVKYSLIVKSVE